MFNATLDEVTDELALARYESAAEMRFGDMRDQQTAAYIYLALAFRSMQHQERPPISLTVDGKAVSAAELFHYAGHSFRVSGQLNRAADAYWRAGIDDPSGALGIRSLAHAKSLYAEIGQADLSDKMHIYEWDARRYQVKDRPTPLLGLWRLTSVYGTSLGRWAFAALALVAAFAITYEALHEVGWMSQDGSWITGFTSLYIALVTTATGDAGVDATHWIAQLVVALNVVSALALVAIGATVLGRKVLGR